jgi:hypothetical protein
VLTPDQIFSNRILWLDADDLSTIKTEMVDSGEIVVAEWRDKGGRNLGAIVVPSPSGNHVHIVPSAVNGRAAIRLGGDAGILRIVGGGSTFIAIVAAYSNPTAVPTSMVAEEGAALLGNIGGRAVVFGAMGGVVGPASVNVGWNDGRFHTFGVRMARPSNAISLRTDGIEATLTGTDSWAWSSFGASPNFGPPPLTTLFGGGMASWEGGIRDAMDGLIAEVIIAGTVDGDMNVITSQLSAYFQKKYGIPF